MRSITIGTRGSRLALAQVEEVERALMAKVPGLAVNVRVIATAGDRDRSTPIAALAGRGVFVKEIERALAGGEIDLAVHSLKDMTTTDTPGLVVAAVPARAEPFDAVYSPSGVRLEDLPAGARVATGSPRRAAQVRARLPALRLVEIRGNIDSRMARVDGGLADALVVARAGLERLGLGGRAVQTLDAEEMLPSPGQGALACQVRSDDAGLIEALALIEDPAARAETDAERAFLRRFGSGCSTPIAALARAQGVTLSLEGLVISPDGRESVRVNAAGRLDAAEQLGTMLADSALAEGAAALIRNGDE